MVSFDSPPKHPKRRAQVSDTKCQGRIQVCLDLKLSAHIVPRIRLTRHIRMRGVSNMRRLVQAEAAYGTQGARQAS